MSKVTKTILQAFVLMLGLSVIVTAIPDVVPVAQAQAKTEKKKRKNIFQLLFGKKKKNGA